MENRNSDLPKDFDLLEMPVEGVAAYWLSLKKLVGNKKQFKMLDQEARYTGEPYVKYLLETGFSDLPDEHFLHLSKVKRESLALELGRKLDLMRLALLDMAAKENPARTLAKMTSKFSTQPMDESQALKLAQEMVLGMGENGAAKAAENPKHYNVNHRLKNDRLLVILLFYVLFARKEGIMACQPFLEFVESAFFCDGLALVVDGFDTPFIRKRLKVHRESIVAETSRKMRMSADMCLGIKNMLTYENIFFIARSYMV